MIKSLASLFLILALASPSRAQTYGAEIPWAALHFVNASGGALPSGKLCTYVNGTTTPQDTYVTSDISATGTKNANPIIMDSSGRPTTNGIYLIAAKYTFVLKTAGTTTDCTTGSTVWTANDVFDLGQLLAAGLVSFTAINNRQYCATGANFGAKFTAAAALLPSTGGIVDCSNLQGAQTIASDVFTGETKPITLIWPTGTASSSVSLTIPTTTTVDFPQGGILSMAAATTATINGDVRGTASQHFAGSGSVIINQDSPVVYPQWFAGTEPGALFTASIAALPSTGGVIDARGLTGAQSMTTKVNMTKAGVTILFGCATYTVSGVAAVQTPFGANFLVTAANNWLIGSGNCTILRSAAGSQADIVGFLHGSTLGGMRNIEFDGNKANNSAISDDSFQSAVQIISDTGSGATVHSRITIDNCIMHDFIHYGIVTYGNLSNGNTITNNVIYSNGKSSDATSTGDGIFINRGSGHNLVQGNRSYSNNRSGIRVSTAGVGQQGNRILNNWTYSNTVNGIFLDEQSNLGSVVNQGQSDILIHGNQSYSNTQYGIRISTANNVGFIRGFTVSVNALSSNTLDGILVQSNAGTSGVSATSQGLIVDNVVTDNLATGISIAVNVLDATIQGNIVNGNVTAQISDSGTRTQSCGNRANVTDAIFNCGPITSTGLIDGANFQVNGGQYRWNEVGVRTWTLTANGGNLNLEPGDALGYLYVVSAAGIRAGNGVAFASLGAPANGVITYCTDCNIANPCTGAGTGALAKRIAGAWVCN